MYRFCNLFSFPCPCCALQMNRLWEFFKHKRKKPEKVPLLIEEPSGFENARQRNSPTDSNNQVRINLDKNNLQVCYKRDDHPLGNISANQFNQGENDSYRGCKINEALEMVERATYRTNTSVQGRCCSQSSAASSKGDTKKTNNSENRESASSLLFQNKAVMPECKNPSLETLKTLSRIERKCLINQCSANGTSVMTSSGCGSSNLTSVSVPSSDEDLTWDAYIPPLQLRWSDVVIKQIFDILESDNEAYIRHIRRLTRNRDLNPINILQKLCWFDEETNTVQALVGVFEYDL